MKKIKNLIPLLIGVFLILSFYIRWNKGYRCYMVLSGSMEPKIKTGSIILIRPVDANYIKVEDIISFKSAINNQTTTHRVIDIERNPELLFTTKGDANEVEDPIKVKGSQIIGKVVLTVPYLGYLAGLLQTRYGFLLIIAIPLLIILTFKMISIILNKVEKREDLK